MIEFIQGKIEELTPTQAVLLTQGGVAYDLNISVYTYSAIQGKEETRLYVYEAIREDAYILYGFSGKQERELFLMLISVPGIGGASARMILSSFSPQELIGIISSGNDSLLKKVKGIGAKTAQRLVIDLKDKIGKALGDAMIATQTAKGISPHRDEAIAALVMLGYQKQQAEKAVELALSKEPNMSAEDLIKFALRNVK